MQLQASSPLKTRDNVLYTQRWVRCDWYFHRPVVGVCDHAVPVEHAADVLLGPVTTGLLGAHQECSSPEVADNSSEQQQSRKTAGVTRQTWKQAKTKKADTAFRVRWDTLLHSHTTDHPLHTSQSLTSDICSLMQAHCAKSTNRTPTVQHGTYLWSGLGSIVWYPAASRAIMAQAVLTTWLPSSN